jgi:hypothetical protein
LGFYETRVGGFVFEKSEEKGLSDGAMDWGAMDWDSQRVSAPWVGVVLRGVVGAETRRQSRHCASPGALRKREKGLSDGAMDWDSQRVSAAWVGVV